MVRPSALPLEEYADVYVGRQATAYLQAYDDERPWFCWVSFGGPHEPWDTTEPYASMYDPVEMPEPAALQQDNPHRPQGLFDRKRPIAFEPGEAQRLRANYAGNVTLIDDQVGAILDAIRHRGELENTVIVLASDHGEMNGDYGLIYKDCLMDSAARVPLIVRTPQTAQGAQGGQVCGALTEWMDIGPTLVELAGGELAHTQFGRLLTPVLADPEADHRSEAVSAYDGELMICDGRQKVALNHDGAVYLCFDLQDDPGETRNLAGLPEVRAVEDRLRLALLERLVQTLRH